MNDNEVIISVLEKAGNDPRKIFDSIPEIVKGCTTVLDCPKGDIRGSVRALSARKTEVKGAADSILLIIGAFNIWCEHHGESFAGQDQVLAYKRARELCESAYRSYVSLAQILNSLGLLTFVVSSGYFEKAETMLKDKHELHFVKFVRKFDNDRD